MNNQKTLTICVVSFWILNLLFFEILITPLYVSFCNFSKTTKNTVEIHKLIIISDPQLTDLNSYKFISKNSFNLLFVQFLSDIYMKKSFKSLNSKFKNEFSSFIFLGDMTDSGRYENDIEFEEENQRFNNIFKTRKKKFYIPGNHDIGLSTLNNLHIERYKKTFGKLNYSIKIGDFELIMINSEYLERGSQEPHHTDAWNFINSFEKKNETNPRILFTHIPLYRENSKECGREYRSRPLTQGFGYDYQNLLTQLTSRLVLDKIKPIRIFSGDDHEPCEHLHKNDKVIENTVGTFSWLQGNIRPSFGMLNLIKFKKNGKIHHKVHYDSCRTPNQTYIYIWYGFCTLMSLLVYLPLSLKFRYQNFNFWGGNDLNEVKKNDDLLMAGNIEEEEDFFRICCCGCFHLFQPAIMVFCIILVFTLFCDIYWNLK
eukprot:gene609-8113_t